MFLTCDFQIQNSHYFEFGNHMLETFIFIEVNVYFNFMLIFKYWFCFNFMAIVCLVYYFINPYCCSIMLILCLLQVQYLKFTSNAYMVQQFLTYIGIQQKLTWLPTWKAKSFYRVGNFVLTWFFLPLRKFRIIKIKLKKNSYTQTNACLLHISGNFKDIFKYICFTLYLQQTVNNWESAIIFINRCCLPCFYSVDVRSNQFRIDLTK